MDNGYDEDERLFDVPKRLIAAKPPTRKRTEKMRSTLVRLHPSEA